jgi:uncharacterized repeat protein (TIGR02059 family)
MKKTRKLAALIIVLTMMLSLAVPALASGPPEFVSAKVTGSTLVITFDEPLGGTAAGGDFAVLVNTVNNAVTGVAVDDTTVTLTLTTPVAVGATVTVAYSGTGLFCEGEGAGAGNVATFLAQSVDSSWSQTGTGTGTGDAPYVDTTVYEVVLPTTLAMDFTLDPQGLASLAPGQTAPDTDLSATRGKVIARSAAPTMINRSSVPVQLTAAITATAGATTGRTAPTLVATETLVTTGTDMNVLLAVMSSTNKVDDPASTAAFEGTHAVPLVNDTAVNLTYWFDAADYRFVNTDGTITYNRIPTSLGEGTQIQLAGLVNTNASWTNFGSLDVSAVFTFAPHSSATHPGVITTAFGLFGTYGTAIIGTDIQVVPPPVLVPPTLGFHGAGGPAGFSITNVTTASLAIDNAGASGSTIFIPFVGATTANTVIYFTSPTGTVMAANNYTVSSTGITFTATRSDTIRGLAASTSYYIVVTVAGTATPHQLNIVAP